MTSLVKKASASPWVRYVVSAPFSATLAIVIPSFLVRILHIDPDISFYISLFLLFVINFLISFHFVFKQRSDLKKTLVKYTLAALFFRTMDAVWYNFFSSFLTITYEIIVFLSIGTSFTIKFFVYKYLVFKKPQTDNQDSTHQDI